MLVRSWIQGAMALEVLLGLTWIVGFFFLSQQSVAVAYVFTVLNSTQGLFIFVFHCLLNKKVGLPSVRSVVSRKNQRVFLESGQMFTLTLTFWSSRSRL